MSKSSNKEQQPVDLPRLARRIFKRLDADIRDRRGLKHEWCAIDRDIMNKELRPEWEKIITKEIFLALNASNDKCANPEGCR